MLSSVDGRYKIHWQGFARGPNTIPYTVMGVGYMTLSKDKKVSGFQWTSRLPMTGVNDGFGSSEWEFSGTYSIDADDTVAATIDFAPKGAPKPVMRDIFRMVPADAAGQFFRFMSTAPQDMAGNRLDELVSGEAVKVL